MDQAITYRETLEGVDWAAMKQVLVDDDFDNGRSPEQYRDSFVNSYATAIAYAPDGRIVGTVRALSDGVCNAYIVDVWTLSEFRHRGIATRMMQLVLDRLRGQHVYMFTHDAIDFYSRLGFREQDIGMGMVVGAWLEP